MTTPPRVVLLAAGASERLGQPKALVKLAGRSQERRHCARGADASQGFGRGAAVVQRRTGKQLDQPRRRMAIAPHTRRVNGRLPDLFVGVGQGRSAGRPGRRAVDAGA